MNLEPLAIQNLESLITYKTISFHIDCFSANHLFLVSSDCGPPRGAEDNASALVVETMPHMQCLSINRVEAT
jgi:hypothetical protein